MVVFIKRAAANISISVAHTAVIDENNFNNIV